MSVVIASFALGEQRTSFHVVRGNALAIDADVAIFGRAPELRAEMERRGATFQPLSEESRRFFSKPFDQRVRQGIPAVGLWHRVFAVDYRGGHHRLDFRPPLAGTRTHAARLAWNLHAVLAAFAAKGGHASRFVVLPLSWRNPNVCCAAIVAACYGFALTWGRHEPPNGWQFVFCDLQDPSPFLPFLRNETDELAKLVQAAGMAGISHYRLQPIRELASVDTLAHLLQVDRTAP
ncbi:MAG TPA: hypothetical protein VGI81_13310 [Tepidisphaeraceae bacterium]|jgi:hypothetical protein